MSLSLGLLQLVTNADLLTPGSNGTSAPIDQNHMHLLALVNQQQSSSSVQSASSTTGSAQLAQDTYTPSGMAQATEGSDTSGLVSLVKNQTISGSADVRQILEDAIEPYENGFAIKSAWDAVGTDVSAGNYSGAQSALADYTEGLANAHVSLADNSPITALESALQTGNQSDVQAAYSAFSANTPEVPVFVQGLGYGGSGDAQTYAAVGAMVEPGLAADLQKLGYTATNATAEANAIILGTMVDDATLTVNSTPSSDLSQVDGSIADLAKAAAQSTDQNMLSSIIAGMSQANSVTAMESTLTQLDSKYGTAAQAAGADNAGQASVSAYA